MNFYFPWVFLLFFILPFYWLKKNQGLRRAILYGNTSIFKDFPKTFRQRYGLIIQKLLRSLALILFIFSLARPRIEEEKIWQESEGIDLLLVIDASSSMLAEDFQLEDQYVNRLTVVKRVVSDFIDNREQDRIGIIVFSGTVMTLCPLTTDYGILTQFMDSVEVGLLEDGTAIGDALAFSTNRLRHSKSDSKIMILLTDGANNAGKINPELGADLAHSQGIKVYTIGAGSSGPVRYPVDHPLIGKTHVMQSFPIDEPTLKKIAKKTKGQYFRATDTSSLKKIYDEIDALEKTKVETSKTTQYHELFFWFLLPGILFLLLEVFLSQTYFLRIP